MFEYQFYSLHRTDLQYIFSVKSSNNLHSEIYSSTPFVKTQRKKECNDTTPIVFQFNKNVVKEENHVSNIDVTSVKREKTSIN